jgi:hypothetical protein
MTEEKFFEEIKQRTGWNFHSPDRERAFGFIFGLKMPYVFQEAMKTTAMKEGFEIWKREGHIGVEEYINFTSSEDALNKICEFLQKPFPVIDKNAETFLVGEYDDRVAQG